MVDLDGAKAGEPVNLSVIERVRAATSMCIEVGGGVRSLAAAEWYFNAGVNRVIFGSAAVSDPSLVREAVAKYGDAIAVGIDAKDGRVRTSGWTEDGGLDYLDFASDMDAMGVSYIIYTDISKDGTLAGPNLAELSRINGNVGASVIASGGIRDIGDIRALAGIGVSGAICGKSIYEGRLDLADAIRAGREAAGGG
jgi:phosphoribosylformimino-5-aminoimidazole carboxamide ribotide isomerase